MRILANKRIEFFIKNLFLSEAYLLKKRAERFYKKQTEREICYLPNLINKSLASIDIGVYRGVYSYFLSKESDYVYAFEANPLLIQKLKNGFQKYKNITIENLAVSSSKGFTNLKIPFRNQNIDYSDYEELYQLGTATIHKKNNLANTDFKSFEIEKMNLDSYTFAHKIGFIKIDVEGHEYMVLKGLFKKYIDIRFIQFEVHNDNMYKNSIDYIKIVELLSDNGFFELKTIKHSFGNINDVIFQKK